MAEHIYIAQTAQGADNGTSAANAHAITWFNTAGNWSTAVASDGKIGPGDTVHWVGTISTAAVMQGSGISGNRITFEWDGTAKFSAPFWSINGAIIIGGQSFLTFDGKNTGTVGARATVDGATWNVSLECTANGTLLANQRDTRGFVGSGGRDITIRNIRSKDLYLREPYGPDINEIGGFCSIAVTANASIENCYIVNGIDGVNIKSVGPTLSTPVPGLNVSDCTILRVSNGIKPGVVGGYIDRATILRNRIDGLDIYSNYQEAPGEDNHHHNDGIQTILTSPPGRVYQMTVAYNHIGPNIGTRGHTTCPIFFQENNEDCRVYNNFIEYAPDHWSSNGAISVNQITTNFPLGGPGLIANNTIMVHGGTQGQTGFGATRHSLIGNIAYGCNTGASSSGVSNEVFDYNIFWGRAADPTDIEFYDGSSIYTISSWRSILGRSIHSIIANPLLNSNGTLQAGSPAIGFAPTQTLFNDDFYGNPRTVPWDAGAFEFSTGGGPTAPLVTSSTIDAAGTLLTITFSESVRIGTGGNGGLTLSAASGPVTATQTGATTGTSLTWTLSRIIGAADVVTRSYAQPGNGIESIATNQDLASFSGASVTNSSTVQQVAAPAFSPSPGAYSSTQNVTMTSSTPGAAIRYTTNGSDPSASSTLYTTPIPTSISTTYKAKAIAAGFLDSAITTGAYQIGDFVITNAWTNIPVATQTGSFTWTFRATSSVSPNDAVMALADHTAAGYSDLAVIARFGPGGVIDAYNGTTSGYTAVNAFPYTAGQAYDFAVSVNIPSHTYSLTVVQAGGSTPVTIASNYGFRGASVSAVDLDVFAALSSLGTVTVSNMVFSSTGTGISRTGMSINPAGTQLTINFNAQPSFGTGGQGGFTVTASGGAVSASNPSIGTNSITWNTLSRPIGRGESVSATYVQPGNGIEAASGGADLASFAGQSVVNNSTVDLTAPTPNPSTFSIPPTTTGPTTITMTATTSTDLFSGPVQYFFNETSGNAGGSDSGWQSSPTFTDTGLAAGTQYTYRVQTRDSASTPNVTTFSASFSATTRSVAGAHPASPFNVARANIVTP